MEDLVIWFALAVLATGLVDAFAATLTVASRTSLHPGKADFACDGIDDQIEIQQALDALPEVGGAVQLMEGTFTLTAAVELPRDRVSLRGMGASTVLEHAPTDWVALARDVHAGDQSVEVSDVTAFRVGQLVGVTDTVINPIVEEGSSYWYYNNYYVKSLIHRIEAIDGKKLLLDRVVDCDVVVGRGARIAPAWVMIKAYGKRHLELADFSLDGQREHVARVYGSYSTYDPPPGYPDAPTPPPPTLFPYLRHGEEITSAIYMEGAHHSRFHGLALREVACSGMFFVQSDHLLVESNTIHGIGLKGYCNVFGSDCRILGNEIIESVYEDGINVYDTPASVSVVADNIVKRCRRACILINQSQKAVVTGNNVRGDDTSDDQGVGIGVVSQEAVVTGNFVEHTGTAIVITALGEFWKVESEAYPITVSGNAIRRTFTGLRVRDADQVTITGNAFSEVMGRAALISVGKTAADGLLVTGNQFMNGREKDQPAIWLGGTRHVICSNQIMGFGRGIYLVSESEECIIENNLFHRVGEEIVRAVVAEKALPA